MDSSVLVVCFVDSLLNHLYWVLAATALSSLWLGCLTDLASHGKTRKEPANITRNGNTNPSSLVSSCQKWLLHSNIFLVHKCYFSHFYVCGIVFLASISHWSRTTSPSRNHATSISVYVLYLHLFRRLYECLFVHRWRVGSKMHVAGYAVGMLHYGLLPFVFLELDQCAGILNSGKGPFRGMVSSMATTSMLLMTEDVTATTVSFSAILAFTICAWAQYQQHRHHKILASLRSASKSKIGAARDQYRLPAVGWFKLVVCPHYLAEVIIYVSFAWLILLERPRRLLRVMSLVLWVTTNLTVSALQSYAYYKNHLPHTAMATKKAIIPCIL